MADPQRTARARGCGGGGRGRRPGAASIPVQRALRALGAQPVVGARARPRDRPAQLRGARRERAGRAWSGSSRTASTPSSASRGCSRRSCSRRRPTTCSCCSRRRSPTSTATCRPSCASTRRSSACAAASTPCARSPTATWISSPRRSTRASSTTSGKLSATSDEDEFLAAVVVYHLLAEGVIARTAQNLAATQYERLAFPGLAEGQRLVARDEARHIGIGVSYVRRRMDQAPERTTAVITRVIEELLGLWAELLGPGRRRARRPRPLAATGSSRSTSTARPCGSSELRLASVGYDAEPRRLTASAACASASSPTTTTRSSGASPSTSTDRP